MSGGHYEYVYLKVDQLADDIELGTGEGHEASPEMRARFKVFLHKVARALRAIEYNDSGDGDSEEVRLLTELVGPGVKTCPHATCNGNGWLDDGADGNCSRCTCNPSWR